MNRAIWADVVVPQTANTVKILLSAAADSRNGEGGGVLERGEGLVRLECLAERLCTLWAHTVVEETANGAKIGVSAAADSRNTGNWWHTRQR